jgi:hypothetical protein
MNISPEQIAEWRKEAESAWLLDTFAQIREGSYSAYIKGYIRARTEQATEIAALKAQLEIAHELLRNHQSQDGVEQLLKD